MKIIERILITTVCVIVLIFFCVPQASSQFYIKAKSATAQLGRNESKAIIKEAKKLRKEIERREKEIAGLLKEDAPEQVKERRLEEFKMHIS